MPSDARLLPPKFRKNAKDLTPQRVIVLEQLVLFQNQHEYPPSLRELAERLNLRSPSTVHAHLESLERQGLVHREPRTSRAWRATAGGRSLGEQGKQAA